MIEFLTHFWSPNLGGHQSLLRLRSRRRMSAPANDAVQRANVWWRDSGASVKSGSKQNYTAPWFACLLGFLRRCFFFCWGDCKGSGHHLGWNLKNPIRTFSVSWSDWEHIILPHGWKKKRQLDKGKPCWMQMWHSKMYFLSFHYGGRLLPI